MGSRIRQTALLLDGKEHFHSKMKRIWINVAVIAADYDCPPGVAEAAVGTKKVTGRG